MADQNNKLERDYYEPVKDWLNKILAEKFLSRHLEVTAGGKFSNTIQEGTTIQCFRSEPRGQAFA